MPRMPVRIAAPLLSILSACQLTVAHRSSGGQTLEVVANDYAFVVPDTVDAGPTLLHLQNAGRVQHELLFSRLKSGATAAQVIEAQKRDETVRPFIDGGSAVLIAAGGTSDDARVHVNFEAGRDYLLLCNFTDGEGKPPHFMLGMFKQIHVRGPANEAMAASMAALDSALTSGDTSVRDVVVEAMDYAFRVADTLPAGPTNFRMRNTGKVRHEIAMDLLKPGVTVQQVIDGMQKGEDIDPLFETSAAILTARAGEVNAFALRQELLPGRRYLLGCEFSDSAGAPPHIALGMFKEIVVR